MMQSKERAISLHEQGLGYKRISQIMGLSVNTVKTYCHRAKEGCQYCGKPVAQFEGRKHKKFCSDACRMKWWNEHRNLLDLKANYEYICPTCHKTFTAYGNKNRKYCSFDCYVKGRFYHE